MLSTICCTIMWLLECVSADTWWGVQSRIAAVSRRRARIDAATAALAMLYRMSEATAGVGALISIICECSVAVAGGARR